MLLAYKDDAMGKRGRARKSGQRHDCGKLKQPTVDPIAPALYQRIATEAKRGAADARLGTELGRLFLFGELTSAQVAAGFRIARTYQNYEKLKGKRRSPASPSYGEAGDHSIAEELMGPEALIELEDRILDATEKFKALDKWMRDNLSREMRSLLQDLCVADWHVGPMTGDIRKVLDDAGAYFGFTGAAKQKKPAAPAPVPTVAKPNVDRIYFIEVLRRLRPDLSEDDLGRAYDVQRALVARAIFRKAKEKRSDNVVPFPPRSPA